MIDRSPIHTSTGQTINLSQPDPKSINILDIAHGLSRMPRFSGQTVLTYSVADHCLLAAHIAQTAGRSHSDQLLALLHDAAEAYICDLPSPIKVLCPTYKKVEQRLLNCILKRFGLKPIKRLPQWLKTIDDQALEKERQCLFNKNLPSHWESAIVSQCQFENVFTELQRKIILEGQQ